MLLAGLKLSYAAWPRNIHKICASVPAKHDGVPKIYNDSYLLALSPA